MGHFLGFGRGVDGSLTWGGGTWNPTRNSCSGSSGSVTLSGASSIAAGKLVLIHQSRGTGVGQWELNQVQNNNGSSLTMIRGLDYTYTDSGNSQAQVNRVYEYKDFTLAATGAAPNWDENVGGIICFMVQNKLTITGTLHADSAGYRDGGWGPQDPLDAGWAGEGSAGDKVDNQTSANGNGGGGASAPNAGDSRANSGGGGGSGSSGSNGVVSANGTAGSGGSTSGTNTLTSITFGGSGGGGSAGYPDCSGYPSPATQGAGGKGAGLIIIYAREIDISGGYITANGGNGYDGCRDGSGGGGGGAGGQILLYGEKINIGTSRIRATGGVGGIEGGYPNSIQGGAGGKGRIAIYSCSLTGSVSSTYYGSYYSDVGGKSWCGSVAAIMGG